MLSYLNKSGYRRGSPDFKAGDWLCCLEEGKGYNMKTRLMCADVLCAFAECLSPFADVMEHFGCIMPWFLNFTS